MSDFFHDPNANAAFDMMSIEELSKQKSAPKQKKKSLSTVEIFLHIVAGAIAGLILALRD